MNSKVKYLTHLLVPIYMQGHKEYLCLKMNWNYEVGDDTQCIGRCGCIFLQQKSDLSF